MPGLALIFSAVAHAAYMNGPDIPRGWWTIAFLILGWYLTIVGGILALRSISVFGVDYLTLLYVYYPEESRVIDSSIYSILRHPIYSAVLHLCVGLAFINSNANSIAFTIFAPLLFFGWARLVEEKELIERFGQSYLDYRKRVPAFWPRPRDIGKFFAFLFTGA
jgi:protein-S-isoprenylcysteine O-methyltransferase Ste14